jgi:RimJ/RimL family protein N-acetyltransferase
MPRLIDPVLPVGSIAGSQQPVLKSGDLTLRPWTEGDADALLIAFADPAIQRWHGRTVESRQEALDIIVRYNRDWRTETAAHWAITTHGAGLYGTGSYGVGPEVLGRVALRLIDLDEGTAEIAYWVMPGARGRGTAVRAAVALGQWALDDLGLHRLDLQHSVVNTASCRVADKAGYVYEGTKRSSCLHTDGWHDMHMHARVRGDR